ncbi:MAG: membrane receptor RagA, partial [Lachnospiraceae bacterium]|nr:membrane receptor RagA [Lachnospiraceae bacterium]
ATMGAIRCPSYPEDTKYIKEEVERPAARLDGKKVCNILREQRIQLAKANHIPFRSEECPSIGPCAGTCDKCDMESEYLRKQLQKIPEEKRVYPQFDPAKEVLS